MYIHAPEGSWLDYPDWRTKYLLRDEGELERLRDSGAKFFIIDTEQGCDASPTARAPRPAKPAASATPAALGLVQTCSAEEEFGRAKSVVENAGRSVEELLTEARLGKAVDVARTLPIIQDISRSIDRNSSALISYVRMKASDEYTYLHSVAVCALMMNLGRQLLFDEQTIADLGTAGLLHDIGKAAIPLDLIKKPGPLTPAEMAQVRQHPLKGADMLNRSRVSDITLDVCLHHHERVDGTGYPHRLKGEAISLHARMSAVCDVYDACTSRRSYKDAAEPSQVLADMFGEHGHFDEQVLGAFIRSVGIYPVGSLVRLKSGRLAIVVEQNQAELTRPLVRAFYSIARRAPITSEDIDLAGDGNDEILSREEPVKWGFRSWDSMWAQMLRTRTGGLSAAA